MSDSKKGLHSLNQRINRLESISIPPSISETSEDQLSLLVNKMKNKEQEIKKSTMKSILEHYTDDIKQTVILSNDNIVKIIIFTIRYVEQNHIKLSGYLAVKSCSEFKHELCLSLVRHVYKSESNEMLDLSVNVLCNEIYPHLKNIEAIKEDTTETIKKKSFWSKK